MGKKLTGLRSDAKLILFKQWIFWLGVEKLDSIVRTSGKSMTLHIANVTRLLDGFDSTLETWVAGALHDIEEGYTAHTLDFRSGNFKWGQYGSQRRPRCNIC